MLPPRNLIASILIFSLLTSSFTASAKALTRTNERLPGSNRNNDDKDFDKEKKGLTFRLSQGAEQAESQPTPNLAPATELSQSETESVLKRLPSIKEEASDEKEFALRDRSLPSPRTGKTINVAFPAPANVAAAEKIEGEPLEVSRYAPEGDVPIAPQLSVTFSQPMVALRSQDENAENVPVKLSPQLPGKWRWVGAKTLLFQPEGRFPMSTQYSVTVPAGTKSANGGALNASKTWSFTTPPPTVKTSYPASNSTQPRDALMFVEFNQDIDPAAVLRMIKLRVEKVEFKTRLATSDEIESDEDVRDLVKAAEKDRWLAFRAIDPKTGDTKLALPADAGITVSIEAGTPSAEGPEKTKELQEFFFRTYGPLRLSKGQCGNVNTRVCAPYDTWRIEFTSSLNPGAFEELQVRVEPAIDGLKTSIAGTTLSIDGSKKPNTTYRVTID